MTAKEFLRQSETSFSIIDDLKEGKWLVDTSEDAVVSDMIKFAQYHVELALKAKIKAMQKDFDGGFGLNELDAFSYDAYPITNIK